MDPQPYGDQSDSDCCDMTIPANVVRSRSLLSNDLASSLLNPLLRLAVDSSRAPDFTPAKRSTAEQVIPSSADLKRWQSAYRPDRRVMFEVTPEKSRDHTPVPVFALARARKGANPGQLWFPRLKKLKLRVVESTNKRGRLRRDDSFSNVFPTATSSSAELSASHEDLVAYAASARTAFQSEYLKRRSPQRPRIDITQHPEYESYTSRHKKPRDHVIKYREAMLRLRPLIAGDSRALLS